jgi:tripartite-type tricarboxylate transporter receptor subunit TctC
MRIATCLLLLLFASSLASSLAAQGFTQRPIRLVATSTPGSPVDIYARTIAEPLARSLGQTVVVDNRAGAGGTLAAGIVLGTEGDGHVALVNTNAQVIAPFTYSGLAFDMLRDFSGIGPIAALPNVVIAPPQRGWKSLREMLDAGRARPGSQSYGTGGSGTGTHLAAELLRMRAAIAAVQVPYKGSPEVLAEIISGRIDWSVVPLSTALGQIREGRIQALALSAGSRSPQAPEVPTLTEAGLKDADFPFWVGMFVPARVPRPVVRRLHDETAKAMQSPEARERLTRLGAELIIMSPEQFDGYVKSQAAVAATIVKAANIRAN